MTWIAHGPCHHEFKSDYWFHKEWGWRLLYPWPLHSKFYFFAMLARGITLGWISKTLFSFIGFVMRNEDSKENFYCNIFHMFPFCCLAPAKWLLQSSQFLEIPHIADKHQMVPNMSIGDFHAVCWLFLVWAFSINQTVHVTYNVNVPEK